MNATTRSIQGSTILDYQTVMNLCRDAVTSRGYHVLKVGESRLVCVKTDENNEARTRAVVTLCRDLGFVTTYSIDFWFD